MNNLELCIDLFFDYGPYRDIFQNFSKDRSIFKHSSCTVKIQKYAGIIINFNGKSAFLVRKYNEVI